MNRIFKGKEERYLVVEERDGEYAMTRATLDGEHKRIAIIERRSVANLKDIRRLWRGPTRLIFALSGRKAATVEGLVAVERSGAGAEISETELEELVSKGLWEFLNRYRPWALKKLGVADLDLAMSDIQVREVLLDGRKIFNPAGFDGRTLSFRLRATFVARSIVPLVARFRSWGPISVVESGSVLAAVSDDGEWLVLPEGGTTLIYRRRKEESALFKEIPWDAGAVSRDLRADLFLDEETLTALVERYDAGLISERIRRLIDASLHRSLESLAGAVQDAIARSGAKRPLVRYHLDWPFRPQAAWKGRLHGELLRLDEDIERENFFLEVGKKAAGFSAWRDQSIIALLLYSYESPKYGYLNRVLRRRVPWLIPNL